MPRSLLQNRSGMACLQFYLLTMRLTAGNQEIARELAVTCFGESNFLRPDRVNSGVTRLK
ncbi:hypothetical protein SAMN06265222_107314 [Neorhodopirellula lusitana]|uniref:Uncharacterized protein n=1 Tax=Neorhodopirellula lusitana TaxID=445327 RepID=A0ABY1Q869_9BACT|nr:hypothetical protein SAMN06265222_107314 [Neorhodopirellula lusitana]